MNSNSTVTIENYKGYQIVNKSGVITVKEKFFWMWFTIRTCDSYPPFEEYNIEFYDIESAKEFINKMIE